MQKTYYALRYPIEMPEQPKTHEVNPNAPKPKTWRPPEYWYAKNNAGKLVGLDRASGGYPYPTNHFKDVQLWDTPEQADKYRGVLNKEKFERVRVIVTIEDDEDS